ncbi:MAG TPA: class I SAM-dependent methyltransferase [Chloroflexota bacterium]
MQGLAILRAWGTDSTAVRARANEIVTISRELDDGLYSDAALVPEYEVGEGYRAWASAYDSTPNILFDAEEPVVHDLLSSVPRGRALDAACGTGRHAAWLAEQGYEVVGIDAVEEMLSIARDKVPSARFRKGRLETLDLPDASVDLAVCALALTHLPAIDQAIGEMARVLAPGGHLVLSDVHPLSAALGLHAFFRSSSGDRGCIQNQYHPISRYLDAFRAAHLEVEQCVEVPWNVQAIASMPTYDLMPQALRQALQGLPLLLIWELSAPVRE